MSDMANMLGIIGMKKDKNFEKQYQNTNNNSSSNTMKKSGIIITPI